MGDLSNDQIHNFVLADITEERERQDAKWGANRDQPCRNMVHRSQDMRESDERKAKWFVNNAAEHGQLTWEEIVEEEFCEAKAAKTDAERRGELVQLAAVVVAWIEGIDRRRAGSEAVDEPLTDFIGGDV